MADTNISAYSWLCSTLSKIDNPLSDGNNIVCTNETDTVDGIVTDAYDKYGLKCVYYRVTKNLFRDKLYGEDQLRMVERAWFFNGYVEKLPPNVRTYQLQGIWGEDLVSMYASIDAFNYYSTYGGSDRNSPEIYEVCEPAIGDIIYIPANDTFYDIRDVKYYSEAFGLNKHTYTLSLKVYKDDKYTISAGSPTISDTADPIYRVAASALSAQSPIDDILKINDDLTSAYSGKIPYQTDMEYKYPESKKDNPRYYDPFDGW